MLSRGLQELRKVIRQVIPHSQGRKRFCSPRFFLETDFFLGKLLDLGQGALCELCCPASAAPPLHCLHLQSQGCILPTPTLPEGTHGLLRLDPRGWKFSWEWK